MSCFGVSKSDYIYIHIEMVVDCTVYKIPAMAERRGVHNANESQLARNICPLFG